MYDLCTCTYLFFIEDIWKGYFKERSIKYLTYQKYKIPTWNTI